MFRKIAATSTRDYLSRLQFSTSDSGKKVLFEIVSTDNNTIDVQNKAISELQTQMSQLMRELKVTQDLLRQSLGQQPAPKQQQQQPSQANATRAQQVVSNDPLAYRSGSPQAASAPEPTPAPPVQEETKTTTTTTEGKEVKPSVLLEKLAARRKVLPKKEEAGKGKTQEVNTTWQARFDPEGCHPDIYLLNDQTTAKCGLDGDVAEGSTLVYVGIPPEGTSELKFRIDRLGIGMIYVCDPDTQLNPDNLTPLDYSAGAMPAKLSVEGATLAFYRSGDIHIHTPQQGGLYQLDVQAGHVISVICTRDVEKNTTQVTFKVGRKTRLPRSFGPYTLQTANLAVAVGLGWKGTAVSLIP